MKQIKVMFDLDGVLSDFVLGFTTVGKHLFGTEPIPTSEQRWYDDFGNLSLSRAQMVWKWIDASTNFWAKLLPIANADERFRIEKLSNTGGVSVYFVTSRGRGIDPLKQTQRWAHYWFPSASISVVVTPRKGEAARVIGADFAIDDKAGNAVYTAYHTMNPETRQPGTRSYILDRAYNRFDHQALGSKVSRVNCLSDFLTDVEDAVRGAAR